MPFILSVLMTAIISLVSTIKALGFAQITFANWLSAWAWSWIVAFPTLLIVLPLVKKIVQLLVQWKLKRMKSDKSTL
ncbi:hypothetical protein CWE08_01090 [Aliidiomarina iranensis]|uniref:DUF2798 domain-containing protein n=2 Tax=Aliidiomarina iranensis TaxID=1434071 RepID=A0A432W3D3_9GAMM|nr:hypothetical protein CWE08_01090 [Aliidiomarina iranensis]